MSSALAAVRFLPGIEHRLRGFSLAAAVTLAFSCVAGVVLYRQDTLDTTVLDVGQGQCVALLSGQSAVAVDCGGEALREAIQAKPALVNLDIREFCELTGADPENRQDVLNACRRLCFQGVGRVFLTWGSEGVWLVSARGAWACDGAKIEESSAQDAGDTMLAALLAALSRGMPDPEALWFASAAVMHPDATLCRRNEKDALLPELSARPLIL